MTEIMENQENGRDMMRVFGKNKEKKDKEGKDPWWIAALAELVFIFLLAYVRTKREKEEKDEM